MITGLIAMLFIVIGNSLFIKKIKELDDALDATQRQMLKMYEWQVKHDTKRTKP